MRKAKEGGKGKGGNGSGQALKILRPRAARGDATETGVSGRNRRGGGSGGDGGGGAVVRLSCGDDDDEVGISVCAPRTCPSARVRTGIDPPNQNPADVPDPTHLVTRCRRVGTFS